VRSRAGMVANGAAWAVVLALACAAVLVANRLGFAGLFLLGSATWLVCTRAALDRAVPSWGVAVFRAAAETARSPEEREAAAAARQQELAPLRFYGRCGAALAAIGALGVAWQVWSGPSP
jgi:hypothetical protein